MNDLYHKGPNFSGTQGLGEIEKISKEILIPDNFVGVKNYQELKEKINNLYILMSGKQIKHFTKGLFNLLNQIQSITKLDPVEYLYFLYYGEKSKMSVDQIAIKLMDLGVKTNSSMLDRNLRNRLGWDLTRENRQLFLLRQGRIGSKDLFTLSPVNAINAEDIKLRSDELIAEVVENNKGRVFAILSGEIEKIYLKADKIAYILHKYGLIKYNSKEELKIFLLKIKSEGIGVRKIAKIINNLINSFDSGLKIKISHTNISHMIK